MGKFDRFMVDVHIGTNRKMRGLTVAQRWCFVAGVLPIAAMAPERGTLMIGSRAATHRDYAEQAGVSPKVALAMTSACLALALIEPDERLECDRVHDFDDWNPKPKGDPRAAERQRRYREKHSRNGVVTPRDVTGVTDRDGRHVTPGREEKVKDVAKATSRRGTEPSDADRALCRLLAELVIRRDPAMKARINAESDRWSNDMRLLRERDGRSQDNIEKAIRWSQDSTFWAPNILSPGKLREQFPTLWGQMHRPANNSKPVETSDEFYARRGG